MQIIHSNENYDVVVHPAAEFEFSGTKYVGGYSVLNRETGITEFRTPSMPEALNTSEQLNHVLVRRLWEWRRETPAETAIN